MKNLPVSVNSMLRGLLALCLVLAVFQACKNDDDGTPVTPVDKAALKARLDSANTLYNGAVEGTAVGRYEVGSRAAFKTAIDAATTVNGDNNATQTAVNNANVNLGQAVTTFRSKQVTEIAPANLVLHLLMNGNANDASGKGFNGTLKTGAFGGGVPTPTANRFGVANQAYLFNKGSNIEIPYNSALNPAKELTISLWARMDSSWSNNYMVSLNRWNGYKMNIQQTNKVFFTVKTNNNNTIYDRDNATIQFDTLGRWRHFVVTYKSGEMNFYVNGSLLQSWTDLSGDLIPVKSSINLTIGQDLPNTIYNTNPDNDAEGNNFFKDYGGYFVGAMDDLRMYNVALSSTQITSIYNAEKSQ